MSSAIEYVHTKISDNMWENPTKHVYDGASCYEYGNIRKCTDKAD